MKRVATYPSAMLLLAGALSLHPAASADTTLPATGNEVRQTFAIPISKKPAKSEAKSTISYECDDECLLPGAPVPAGKYAVVAPVGKQRTKMIAQAPRLDTLNSKTIAVVGGSFMANITHPEIKRLILANYPTAKVIMLSEIGSAGPFPGPGVVRQAKDEFESNLKKMGVHAVISGNGGCGLCTPKETGSSITAEYIGIPAVTVAAPTFVNQVYSTAVNHGVPAPRAATYPGAFSAHTPDELAKNTREVVWPQLVEALTNRSPTRKSPSAATPRLVTRKIASSRAPSTASTGFSPNSAGRMVCPSCHQLSSGWKSF